MSNTEAKGSRSTEQRGLCHRPSWWAIVAAREQLPFHQFAHQALRCRRIAPALHQHIKHVSLLVHRLPHVVGLSIDREEDLIQVPFISRARPSSAQLIGELLTTLLAPAAARLIADLYTAQEQRLFHRPETQQEAHVQQHALGDDLGGKPMPQGRGCCARHGSDLSFCCAASSPHVTVTTPDAGLSARMASVRRG